MKLVKNSRKIKMKWLNNGRTINKDETGWKWLNKVEMYLKVFPKLALILHVCSTNLENTVGKGEIARHEQFLLLQQCFLHFLRTSCNFHQS